MQDGVEHLVGIVPVDHGAEESRHHLATARAEIAQRVVDAQRLQARPDMVLLDIWMPDTDGITLLKEWASAGLLTMPVVMMSGHGTIDTAVEATRIGAFDFLEKPITLQKLLATVGKAFRSGEQKARPTLMSCQFVPRSSLFLEFQNRGN